MISVDRPDGNLRIALTGGPGGGKTTAADLLRRELGDLVVLVPEAATILFEGGFPRVRDPDVQRAAQRAIFQVQSNLEDVKRSLYPDQTLLCDRGTVDGAAYWPEECDGAAGFFAELGTTLDDQLHRYDLVVFFETAAAGGHAIHLGNRHRIESIDEAVAIDHRLRAVWGQHPRFHFVPHRPSFMAKMNDAISMLLDVVGAGHAAATAGDADGLAADAG